MAIFQYITKKHIVVVALMLFTLCSTAQQLPLKFHHLSYKEGLVQSPIGVIFQDDKGFIWIGNWKGLTRYNGYDFHTYRHQDKNPKTISNNRVNTICEDGNKNLWIGTSNGLNIYDPKADVFKSVGIQNIKGGRNYISSVIQDGYGNLWAATFGGVKQVDTVNYKLTDVKSFSTPQNSDIFSGITFILYQDKQSTIWVGTRRGVKRFNPKTQQIIALPKSIQDNAELMAAKVLVIQQDRNGDIWFGTETSGLFRYSNATGVCVHYIHSDTDPNSLSSDWVKAIMVHSDNTIWIGTRRGLSIFDSNTGVFKTFVHNSSDDDSLNDSTIWSFLQDNASGVWIGTFAGGINIYYPGNNNFSNVGESKGSHIGLNHPVVNAISEDADNKLWIGTMGGGLNLIDRKTGSSSYYSVKSNRQGNSSNGVKAIAPDKQGNLWIGTLDGLCRFNKQTKAVTYYKFPVHEGKLSENLINTVLPDNDGVWAGTNGGGLQFLNYSGQFITYQHDAKDKKSLSDNFVTALIKDDKGNLWIGTQNGLNYFNTEKRKFTAVYKRSERNSISNSTVISLFYDNDHHLWIGTENGSLNYFDEINKLFYVIDSKLGLTDDVIHAIVQDNSGKLWLSTDNGLFKVHFKNFKVPFNANDIEVTQYTANDGLASNQFETNSGIKTRNGDVLFGGINGLTVFNPNRLLKNTFEPKVILTNLLIKNKPVIIGDESSPLKQSITETKTLTLSYDQGFISLEFAALNFNNPENNQYAYKLQGLNNSDGWHYVGTQHSASYTNLQPGDYKFIVKATNNDGVWSNNTATINITVLPPFWRTWWAYLLYLLSFATVLYVAFNIFQTRAKLKRDLYHEHLQNERQQEMYQMKLNFFTNVSHEIRTPLTLILGPLEKIMESARKNGDIFRQLGHVKNNADRLMRLVTELLDFRKAETGNLKLYYAENDIVKFLEEIFLSFQNLAMRRNINYTFEQPEAGISIYMDKDQLEKVFFNLLSNAFKFTTDGGTIHVSVKEQNSGAEIQITDNGKGIPESSQDKLFVDFFQVDDPHAHNLGTGIGLALSKNIVELHKGLISVYSKPATATQNGVTVFTVWLRGGDQHLDTSRIIENEISTEDVSHYYIQSQVDQMIDEKPVLIAPASNSTILIVEDNDEIRRFIREALETTYNVIENVNGALGLQAALQTMPDMIITDVMMPEMDGTELCRHVKSDERLNHIPVIMLTARAAFVHQLNGFEHGADAYITKPFSLQLLQLQVHNILASKKAMQQRFSRELLLHPRTGEPASPEEKFLVKLMAIIEKNIEDTEFGVTELMDEIGMSKNVLYKKVQMLTDLSVADFIKSIRLQKAMQLLDQNQLSIANVAFAVGFNDRKYFSKEFKKQFDLSPSEYLVSRSIAPKSNKVLQNP
ncbi:MAG: two-component regulator propeller domain-containing protein [Mucilaginibacter sp.]|uniref:hybrid sensor histidine kinase/response regulator transcription factor n=1 Tax=Mucilaginibacter sp. TaxID=1882438 RepID=UPI003265C391